MYTYLVAYFYLSIFDIMLLFVKKKKKQRNLTIIQTFYSIISRIFYQVFNFEIIFRLSKSM
jgi:hypothetical protein